MQNQTKEFLFTTLLFTTARFFSSSRKFCIWIFPSYHFYLFFYTIIDLWLGS